MDYLTVTEFAEKVGVTPQAIYKRIKGDLAPYVKIENGVKLIQQSALELFTVKQQVSQPSNEDFLKSEVERLTAELQVKEQIINELNNKFSQQSEKLLEILDRQTTQFQLLLAYQQTSTQQLINALTPPEPVEPIEEHLPTIVEPVKKQGLLKRLFTKSH